jgi:hypothetical protein
MTRHVTFMTIDDAGHYSPQQRAEIIAAFPMSCLSSLFGRSSRRWRSDQALVTGMRRYRVAPAQRGHGRGSGYRFIDQPQRLPHR